MVGLVPIQFRRIKTINLVNSTLGVIFPNNVLLGSNYMYLNERPIVDNPFLIGEWPWYILGFEVAGALHILIMDLFFRIRPFNKRRLKAIRIRVRG